MRESLPLDLLHRRHGRRLLRAGLAVLVQSFLADQDLPAPDAHAFVADLASGEECVAKRPADAELAGCFLRGQHGCTLRIRSMVCRRSSRAAQSMRLWMKRMSLLSSSSSSSTGQWW